jgi:hypothetical protein
MKKENELKEIVTRLPIFNGFYNTIFSIDNLISDRIEDINQTRLDNNLTLIDSNKLFELIEVDNNEYQNDVAVECCNVIEHKLKELNLISSIKFNSVISPKEYNYINDRIDCTIELSQDNIINIKKYLELNSTWFSQYLHSEYSSRNGFMSFYPNTVTGWIELTNNFTDYSDYNTLYSVLDFICDTQNINIEYLYYEICDTINLNVLNSDVLNTLEYDSEIDKFIKITNCGKSLFDMYNEYYDKQLVIFDKPEFNTWFKSNQNLFTFEYVDKFGEIED